MSGLALSLGLPARQGAVRDPDAAAIMAAMTTPPSAVRAGQIDRLVTALKGCGVWRKLDSLFVFAAHHEQAARIDWKQPTRIATAHGGPVFEPDRGWAFDGVDDYLATGFVPFDHCTQATGTAGCHGVYELTDVALGSAIAYGASMLSTRNLNLNPRTDTNLCAGQYNNPATGNQVASTDSRGLWVVQRDGDQRQYFHRGASMGSITPASSGDVLVGIPIYVGAVNQNGNANFFRPSHPGAWCLGGLLTFDKQRLMYEALRDYMAALGAED